MSSSSSLTGRKQTLQNDNNDTSGREQLTLVLLDALVEAVWEVWTKPEHITHWWGPEGFTNSIERMEVEPGGHWIFIMHGPDGKDYPNKTIFREVVKQEKLVHEHFDPNFIATITFERRDDKTLLTWYKLYETIDLFEMVEKHYKSSEGFNQTVEKLKSYLTNFKTT